MYNVDGILDAHTHLTGRESADHIHQILECMDFCGVEKAFVFAPMPNVGAHQITSDSLDDIRTHNGYCADVCSKASERLLGFCTLIPMPALAGGDLDRAVDLVIGKPSVPTRAGPAGRRGAGRDRLVCERPLARLAVSGPGHARDVHGLSRGHARLRHATACLRTYLPEQNSG